ncbi:MAG: methyltransferase domain-containing protein [Phormidesmis sp.]
MERAYNTGQLIETDRSLLNRIFKQTIAYWNNVTIARQSINRKYLSFIKKNDGKLVEIGGTLSFQKYMLHGKCILLDIEDKLTNDVTANAESLPFASESIDGFLCVSVLEHTQNPRLVIDEIWRCLKPGGEVFLSVPWLFESHMEPLDFFRFSKFILSEWFTRFEVLELEPTNGYFGLLAHFMQSSKLLSLFIGTFFLWLDLSLNPDFRWTTQINLIAKKPMHESSNEMTPNQTNHTWLDILRCPNCTHKGDGELIFSEEFVECCSCNTKYFLAEGKRPVFK